MLWYTISFLSLSLSLSLSLDSCETYQGEICKDLEGYDDTNVLVTRNKQLHSQEAIEEKIALFFRSVLFLQPTEGCKDILRVLLCHGAFPHCTQSSTKQLCSAYCQFNRTLKDLCPSIFEELSKFASSNENFMGTSDCNKEDDSMGKEEGHCMTVQSMAAGNQDPLENKNGERKEFLF